MIGKMKHMLYVSFALIIVPVMYFIMSDNKWEGVAALSLIEKGLLLFAACGLLVFVAWFLVGAVNAIMDFVKDAVIAVPFLISIITGKHKKQMQKAEETAKNQSELLAKLEELNDNQELSDDEHAEQTLQLFKEYGIDVEKSAE